MFDCMMQHNIVLRDAMYNYGVKKVIEHIRAFAPKDQKQEARFDSFIDKYPDGSIGNLDIQVYSVNEDIEILGYTFRTLQPIGRFALRKRWLEYVSESRMPKSGGVFMSVRCGRVILALIHTTTQQRIEPIRIMSSEKGSLQTMLCIK